MKSNHFIKLLSLLLIVKFASSRSVSHTQTTLKSNGDKVTRTWTESDDADDHPLGPFPVLLPPDSEPTDFTSIANTDTLRDIKPYKETIRIGASSLDELRKQAVVAKGMDPAAVSELLATKQPVIKTTTDEKGQVRTTTYKLEPDGGISSRTIIELRPELPGYIHPLGSGFNLEGLPAWSTQSQPEPKWPQISSQNWPELEAVPSSPTTDVQLPESWNPNLWGTQQKPYFKPTYHTNPDVEVFAPRKSTPFDKPIPFPDENTDPFGSFGSHPPGTYTKTTTDDNGNTIKTTLTVNKNTFEYPIDRPFAKEFPSKHWFESPSAPTTRKPITNWPSSLSTTTVRTIIAKKPDIFNLTEPEKPSLEDFLKSQYGHIPRERPPTPTQPTKPKIATAYVPLSPFMPSKPSNPSTATSQNPIATINVDDLPVAEVLRNGKPVQDEDYFGTLPSEMRPTLLSPTTVYNIKNIPQTPTLEDFDPVIRERLVSAGITNEDLRRMQGDEITKTTVDPNGKITRTTIKVRLVPQTVEPLFQPKLPYPAVHQLDDTGKGLSPADTSNTPDYIPNYGEAEFPEIPPYELPVDSWKPKNPIKTEPKIDQGFTWPTPNPTACSPKKDDVPKNPVDAFLHKLDLKAADLFSNHGEWLKTIVDENGRVLTVKLTLSDIVDESKIKQEKATPRPLK